MKKLVASFCLSLILFSCKKDNNTPDKNEDKDTVVTPIPHDSLIVTKSRFWNYPDTAALPPSIDSVVYLEDGITVDKIITKIGTNGTVTSSYTYNNKGKITKVQVRNEGPMVTQFNWDYNFYYNNAGTQVDSFQMNHMANEDTTRGYLSYNEKQQLTGMVTYFTQGGSTMQYINTEYIRNAAGYIDTIKQRYQDNEPNRVIVLNAPVAADSALKFQPAIRWWLGTRMSNYPFSNIKITLMSQQFYIADENILRSGTLTENGSTTALNIKYTLDNKGAINFFKLDVTDDPTNVYTMTFENEQKAY
jgi:hypothetical protein